MSLLRLINFVITELCNCLPLRFFFTEYRKKDDKNTVFVIHKTERRNLNITEPQEIPWQQNSRNSFLTPYRIINDRDTYNDSYDVFVPVYEYGCNIQFQTAQEPYIERYFVCFKDYVHDNNGYSEEENK